MAKTRRGIAGLMALVAIAGLILGLARALGGDAAIFCAILGLCAWPALVIRAVDRSTFGGAIPGRVRMFVLRGSAANALIGLATAIHSARRDESALVPPGFASVLIAAVAAGMLGFGLLLGRKMPPGH